MRRCGWYVMEYLWCASDVHGNGSMSMTMVTSATCVICERRDLAAFLEEEHRGLEWFRPHNLAGTSNA